MTCNGTVADGVVLDMGGLRDLSVDVDSGGEVVHASADGQDPADDAARTAFVLRRISFRRNHNIVPTG